MGSGKIFGSYLSAKRADVNRIGFKSKVSKEDLNPV